MFKRFNLLGTKPKAQKVEVRDHDLPPTPDQQRADNKYIADKALASARQKLRDGVITRQEYAILTNPTNKSSIPLGLARANREARITGGKRRKTHRRKGRKARKTHKKRVSKTHRKKGKKGRKARKTHRKRH